MGGPVLIGRGGCLTLLLVAGVLGAGTGGGIPAALRALLEQPDARPVRVVRVIDGDSLVVTSNARSERVRLLGVDAPEASSTRSGRSECGGPLATGATRRWVARDRSRVKLTADRLAPGRDRHRRLLANVRNPHGGDLAGWLVSRGLARTVSYRHRPLAAHPRLLALEAKARGRRKGLWSKCPGWARKHAIPFAKVPAGPDARQTDRRQSVATPMVALLAAGGTVR